MNQREVYNSCVLSAVKFYWLGDIKITNYYIASPFLQLFSATIKYN